MFIMMQNCLSEKQSGVFAAAWSREAGRPGGADVTLVFVSEEEEMESSLTLSDWPGKLC